MLDLLALRRDFIFTTIITNAFKATVKGKVTMLITARKITTALASVAEGGSNPPSKPPHSGGIISWLGWLPFIASPFRLFSLAELFKSVNLSALSLHKSDFSQCASLVEESFSPGIFQSVCVYLSLIVFAIRCFSCISLCFQNSNSNSVKCFVICAGK